MKKVVIVRHGKAVPYGYDDDFNRELTDRGRKDAVKISADLFSQGVRADLIIASPAARALETAQIFAGNLKYGIDKIREEEDIYDGLTTSEFVELIKSLPENIQTVFFFGHNPGFHYFAANLLRNFMGDMPTCSTVGIDFTIESWKELEARTGKLAFHLVPRMYK